jgi:hypothetical protein
MDRKERRRRARERKKLEEKLRKEASQAHIEREGSLTRTRRVLILFRRAISRTRVLWTLVVAGLALLSGYALLHPHVSVEPYLQPKPNAPQYEALRITNENEIFSVHELTYTCEYLSLYTSSGVGIRDLSFGEPLNRGGRIPTLAPKETSTIVCPEGFALGGYVTNLHIQIHLTYRQAGWPFKIDEKMPFTAIRDSQGIVHWTPESQSEVK